MSENKTLSRKEQREEMKEERKENRDEFKESIKDLSRADKIAAILARVEEIKAQMEKSDDDGDEEESDDGDEEEQTS